MNKRSVLMTIGALGIVIGLITAIVTFAWQPIAIGLIVFLGSAFVDAATDPKKPTL